MFAHQLIREIVPSLIDRAISPSLNDAESVRVLLEQHTGFGQFRVVLPGRVIWAPEVTILGRANAPTSLEAVVLSYVPEDRARVVDTIRAAIHERRGFHFTARMQTDAVRMVEVIGDVKVEQDAVTEILGLVRDISAMVERDAMATSRARLIRHLIDDMPIPVVVLDRALRVLAATSEWCRAYGVPDRAAALNQPLGRLTEVSRETISAIIEALNGRVGRVGLWFHSGEDRRQVYRNCVVIPWQSGTEAPGGVLMVIGGEASYASTEIADRALGRTTRTLLEMLETISA
jgi:PAS domain-containing protein